MFPAPTAQGRVPFRDGHTWYRVTGDLDSGYPPVVVAHGGPGSTHHYLLALTALADEGWPVIHYDQLGSGNSTHLPGRGAGFWTVELFLDELANLVGHLDIAGDHILFGQSWGGMLGAEYAIGQPDGLRGLVIANSPASMPIWRAESLRLRTLLAPDVQEALNRHEAAGTFEHPEYKAAALAYYQQFVCRTRELPPEVAITFRELETNTTVYGTMNGPTDFHVIGSLRDWSVVGRLHAVTAPTLVISGRYDEATPATVQPFYDEIDAVEWEILEESSHLPHVEEPERFFAVLRSWLKTVA
jgi:L-proline amide hydrolase